MNRSVLRRFPGLAHLAMLLPIVAVLLCCSRGEVELENTVSAYTRMLGEALAKPDAKVMEFFTSPDERGRIDSYILLLRKDGKVLVSTLKKLEFNGADLERKKNTATVTTYEEWVFHYADEKSRQPLAKEEAIAYRNRYHLIQYQGHWVVDKLDVNEVKAEPHR